MEQKHKERINHWSKAKEGKNDIALRAMEELNGIKQKKLEKMQIDKIEESRKKVKEERMLGEAADELVLKKLMLEKETIKRQKLFKERLTQEHTTDEAVMNPFNDFILSTPVISYTPAELSQ